MATESLAEVPVPGCNCFWYLGVVAAVWWGLRAAWCLLDGARVWVLGSGAQVGPRIGKWAVVTGATDGIGKAYAEELAKRGMNIVLISRSPEKLEEVAKQIKEKFKVETKIIAADFGKPTEIYGRIESGLRDLEIGVLVNNVGVSYEHPEYFLEIPDLENVSTNHTMTRLVLPGMLGRGRGVILNISSASGMYPVPLLTVYSATKVNCFFRPLQSVLPFYVATKLAKIRKPTWDKPSPETYVQSALNTVGLQTQTNGYLPHAIMGWISTSLVPVSTAISLGMKMNKGLRARFLKRAKQK
uniref:3-ketoacyl-CoA reductase n=1 Tax=Xenopus tropicalis TaxID=8364 RepID=A0A6I8QRP8_XENTR